LSLNLAGSWYIVPVFLYVADDLVQNSPRIDRIVIEHVVPLCKVRG
jgi:hypothetical protein